MDAVIANVTPLESMKVLESYARSHSIAALAEALAKAQGEMTAASKDNINPHYKSRYADLASIWEACRGPLSKHGLAVLQPVRADEARVTVTTILAHSSGEWLSESLTVAATQNTAQAVGSAITYGRRYGLAAMVGIAPDDDDGNAATVPPSTRPPLRCTMCARYMGFRWSQAIETQAERDIAAQGLMFNPFVERVSEKCDACKGPIAKGGEFKCAHVGTFCSAACAQDGMAKHQAYMQRLVEEQAAQDRKERPWLT